MLEGGPFPHPIEWEDLLAEAIDVVRTQRRRVAMVNAWRKGYDFGDVEPTVTEQALDPPGGRTNRDAPLRRLFRKGFRQRRADLERERRARG